MLMYYFEATTYGLMNVINRLFEKLLKKPKGWPDIERRHLKRYYLADIFHTVLKLKWWAFLLFLLAHFLLTKCILRSFICSWWGRMSARSNRECAVLLVFCAYSYNRWIRIPFAKVKLLPLRGHFGKFLFACIYCRRCWVRL